MVELAAELHGVTSARPGEVIQYACTALGRCRGGEWAEADACDAADIDQNASLRRTVDDRKVSGVALNGAKAKLIEKVAGEDGSQLNAATVLMVNITGAPVDDAEPSGIVWLVICEPRKANVAAVLRVQVEVDLGDQRPVCLTEGSRADFAARKSECRSIGLGNGDDVRQCVRVVLELPEEKELVFDNRAAEGKCLIMPAAIGLRSGKGRNCLQVQGTILPQRRAMKGIRSRFKNDIDLSTRRTAKLRGVSTGESLGLSHRLRCDDNQTNLTTRSMLRIVQSIKI